MLLFILRLANYYPDLADDKLLRLLWETLSWEKSIDILNYDLSIYYPNILGAIYSPGPGVILVLCTPKTSLLSNPNLLPQ